MLVIIIAMTRIALFGGAFNPPHLGHVMAALHARLVGMVDAVWVLPVCHHPWGKTMAPFDHRLAWCRAAFADLPFVSIHSDEADNPTGTTWALLDLLEMRNPGMTWCVVGGSDMAHDMPQWFRGAELAARLPILVVPRRGHDDHPAALPEISSSLVRQRLSAGESVADLVPAAVLPLLLDRQLG